MIRPIVPPIRPNWASIVTFKKSAFQFSMWSRIRSGLKEITLPSVVQKKAACRFIFLLPVCLIRILICLKLKVVFMLIICFKF